MSSESRDDLDTVSSKLETLLVNNAWNEKNEKLIAKLGQDAAAYKWMHIKSASIKIGFDRFLGMLLVVLNGILTAQSAFSVKTNYNTEEPKYIKSIIYIVTLISIINNFLGYQSSATSHKHFGNELGQIVHDIQATMCLYKKDRPNAIKFIQSKMKRYDTLLESSPEIPWIIKFNFKRINSNSDIGLPDDSGEIHKIDIVSDSRKIRNLTEFNPFEISGDTSDPEIEATTYTLSEYLRQKTFPRQSDPEIV